MLTPETQFTDFVEDNMRRAIQDADLDNQTHERVKGELEAYAQLVTNSCYCVVLNTVIENMPAASIPTHPWNRGCNPKTAVWEFMKTSQRFVIYKGIEHKLRITVAPDGYLKCIAD